MGNRTGQIWVRRQRQRKTNCDNNTSYFKIQLYYIYKQVFLGHWVTQLSFRMLFCSYMHIFTHAYTHTFTCTDSSQCLWHLSSCDYHQIIQSTRRPIGNCSQNTGQEDSSPGSWITLPRSFICSTLKINDSLSIFLLSSVPPLSHLLDPM